MKTTLYIVIILIIVSISFVWLRNISHTNHNIEISAIDDQTDNFISKPKTNDIVQLYDFSDNPYSEAEFRHIEITDISINSVQQASLKEMSILNRNKFKRKDEIKTFFTRIDKIITASGNIIPGKNNSAIYIPIANELNRMSKSTASKRIVLIYSDMMENTDKLSFYDKSVLHEIKTKPERIKQYFESQIKLNKLNGIKIYIIFQPENMEEDNAFNIVSEFYKKLFESKGATVEITANLN